MKRSTHLIYEKIGGMETFRRLADAFYTRIEQDTFLRPMFPKELIRLRAVLTKGLEATESQWPDVRVAFSWVHRAAVILRAAELDRKPSRDTTTRLGLP